MDKPHSSRASILADLRAALALYAGSPTEPLPDATRFGPRRPATLSEEMEMMLIEVKRLGGQGLMVHGQGAFAIALDHLAKAEGIRTAAFSNHPFYDLYPIQEMLKDLGVGIVSPESDRRTLAGCDLGITVADAAIPETGSVLLRTTHGQSDLLSLLPRVHLALVAPGAFLADLHHAFALAKGDRHFVLVSGSSRTADIEKVLTLGVHGPKSFHVWICDQGEERGSPGRPLTTGPEAD